MGFFNFIFDKRRQKKIIEQQRQAELRKQEELAEERRQAELRKQEELIKQQIQARMSKQKELAEQQRQAELIKQREFAEQQRQEELRKQKELVEQQRISKLHKENQEELELKRIIKEEMREENRYHFYSEPIKHNGYCNFLIENYCSKYDFSPVYCGTYSNEYDCSWKERRLNNYKIEYKEDASFGDMEYEKRLTMFGEFYYDKDTFNIENYEDMLDFYDYLIEHFED